MREQEFFRGDVAGLSARDFDGESIKDRTELPDKFPKTGLKENFRKKLRRGAAAAMAMVALSGPIASHAEEAPVPEVTDTAVVVTPEPTAEVKAEVTAAVKDPEAKVSMEDLKAIFESYKRNLFAPYKQELKDNGCDEGAETGWEARVECGAKWLYAYDKGGDMSMDGNQGGDKFQNYISRDEITNYIKTGNVGKLKILFNENNEPRMLMVNCSDRVIQGVVDAIDFFKDNGYENIQEVLYDNGEVIYLSSYENADYGIGSFRITEYGVVCTTMTDKTTKDLEPLSLERANISGLYVESLYIQLLQLKRSVSGMWSLGEEYGHGPSEVSKSLLAGYLFMSIYAENGVYDFKVNGEGLIDMAVNDFGVTYGITLDNLWVKKMTSMVSAISKPLTGINWDDVPEVKQMRETYLTSN